MFIVIEGIDGTGKSTLAKALAARLTGKGHPVTLTREPTDASPWGKRLRASAQEGRLSREEEIDHFHRDRLQHLRDVIRPALARGETVLCDRYVDSTLAYQSRDPQDADRLYEGMKDALLEPDLVLLLECPIELALERIAAERAGRTAFEVEDALRRASIIYASRQGRRYVRLDASMPAESVLEAAWRALLERRPAFDHSP